MAAVAPLDALSRALHAIDTSNRALFASCLVTEPSLTVIARGASFEQPLTLHGWGEQVKPFFERVLDEEMVTLHLMGSGRVVEDGDGGVEEARREGSEDRGRGVEGRERVKVMASVVAYHVKREDAVSQEERKYVAGTLYEVGLVKDEVEGIWKIQRWEIEVLWTTGDRSVLHG